MVLPLRQPLFLYQKEKKQPGYFFGAESEMVHKTHIVLCIVILISFGLMIPSIADGGDAQTLPHELPKGQHIPGGPGMKGDHMFRSVKGRKVGSPPHGPNPPAYIPGPPGL
ncbi:unnamed protein product [Camellia sinensis]